MDENLLTEALTEIDGLLAASGVRLDAVSVFTCDAEAGPAQLVRSASEITLVGGGGTDLTVGIDAAVQSSPRPDLVVVITDGWTPWPTSTLRTIRALAVLLGENPPAPPGWVQAVAIKDMTSPTVEVETH
jgi:predicted metal-dependent peptidase